MHRDFAPQQGLLNLDWMKQNLGNVPAYKRHTQGRNNSNKIWKAGQLFIGRLPLSLAGEEGVRPLNSTVSSVPVLTAGNSSCPKPTEPGSIFICFCQLSSSSSLCSSHITDLPSFPSSAATGTQLWLKTRVKKMQPPPKSKKDCVVSLKFP